MNGIRFIDNTSTSTIRLEWHHRQIKSTTVIIRFRLFLPHTISLLVSNQDFSRYISCRGIIYDKPALADNKIMQWNVQIVEILALYAWHDTSEPVINITHERASCL